MSIELVDDQLVIKWEVKLKHGNCTKMTPNNPPDMLSGKELQVASGTVVPYKCELCGDVILMVMPQSGLQVFAYNDENEEEN